ncbi:MAG: hypothetical protein ACK5UQ_04615 [Planctomycetota bacterium]
MTDASALRRSLLVLATLAAAAPLAAQRQTAVFTDVFVGGAFGSSLAAAPDRSGDGPDLLVGMPEFLGNTGRAAWLNGQGGQVLSSAIGSVPGTGLGLTLTAAGDLNNDGTRTTSSRRRTPTSAASTPGTSQRSAAPPAPCCGRATAPPATAGARPWSRSATSAATAAARSRSARRTSTSASCRS